MKKRRAYAPMHIALILLCMVLVTAHFTSGMYARFITRADGLDSSNVAVFSVSVDAEKLEDGQYAPVSIVSNGQDDSGKASYQIKISNPGETAVRYEAEVSFASEEDAQRFLPGENGSNLLFSGELGPNEKKVETIVLDMSGFMALTDDGFDFDNDVISGSSGNIPFTVTVTFLQID